MKIGQKRCLVCDCQGTMVLDGKELSGAFGSDETPLFSHLCRSQIGSFERAVATGDELLVACTQEAPFFSETAGEEAARLRFANIRERAGWSEEGRIAAPKIAALLAEAAIDIAPASSITLRSSGRCLVYGRGQPALDAALQLKDRLSITLILEDAEDLVPPRVADVAIFNGHIRRASGWLGAFKVDVEGLAPLRVSSRQELSFERRNPEPIELEADIILDLTGGTPFFPAHEKRDGYVRAHPNDLVGVQRALFDAADLVGEFEKPLYVRYEADLCAHSRSRKTGCTRCLDQCPTGAITSASDHVAIEPHICAGCGACAGVCPTGAATYAHPTPNDLLRRIRTLLTTYREAGGEQPVLFLHEDRHGEDLIAMMARFGRGLPARVIPMAVSEIAQIGFDAVAGTFAYGASALVLLVPPRKREESGAIEANISYLTALLEGLGYGRKRLLTLEEDDPDLVEAALWDMAVPEAPAAGTFLPMGGKRERMRLALDQLHAVAPAPADIVAMPEGAPFGTIKVDIEGCTLCLACVGACPTGAILDNPDRPTLRFVEDACVQCGLCAATCPEKVIKLEPRVSFLAESKSPRTIKEEEPACCIRCGKEFGTKSSIERVIARLAGRNWMFQTEEQIERMRMCDDCRVTSQFEAKDNPFAGGTRRPTRATEDYLREREALSPKHETDPLKGNGQA